MAGQNKYTLRTEEARQWVLDNGPILKLAEASRGRGNAKLFLTAQAYEREMGVPATIAAFNLVAGKAGGDRGGLCIGADKCDDWCYAQAGNFEYFNVDMFRRRNQESIKFLLENVGVTGAAGSLRDMMLSWILKTQAGSTVTRHYLLRLHDSGDFFSDSYCLAWANALAMLKVSLRHLGVDSVEVIPYAYTKSYVLASSMLALQDAGVRVVQSLESKWPDKINWDLPVAATFQRGAEVPSGWVNGNTEDMADLHAIMGSHRIALPHHGAKGRNKVDDPLVQIQEAS